MTSPDMDSVPRSLVQGSAHAQLLRTFQAPLNRALRVAVTGGIGSGKSTLSSALAQIGATLADADLLSREVVRHGSEGLRALVSRFGSGILLPSGELDRAALASLIFTDGAARDEVERIVHPLVAARAADILAHAPRDGMALYDVPLLVEAGEAEHFDAVIVVEAPLELRLSRLCARGLSRDEARTRMAAQASDADRKALAHIVVANLGDREDMIALANDMDRHWLRPSRPRTGTQLRKPLR